jgi:hypothetical protein
MNDHQRITIIIDTPDLPANDTVAIRTLLDVVEHLQRAGIYPTVLRLELAPTPPTIGGIAT